MTRTTQQVNNRLFVTTSLGIALLVAVILSPFASSNPDGLDRVAQDHKIAEKAHPEPIAKQLPFHALFDEYATRGVPAAIATPLAGLIGTLATFGLAWGAGKIFVRGDRNSVSDPEMDEI